ncbi:hypothetical protein RMCBS344292_00750 [Rhizopus microsporus]|nr:hypothetical protein RMCBS344292_00750 [Rhizopus microsporus]
MEVFEKKVTAEVKPKRSKTRHKRIKITNTHLSHIDLSKDYTRHKRIKITNTHLSHIDLSKDYVPNTKK